MLARNHYFKLRSLPYLIAPVLMVRNHVNTNTVTTNLGANRHCAKQRQEQDDETSFLHV